MEILNKYQSDLKRIKMNIKLCNAAEVIVNAYINRDQYKFTALSGDEVSLFRGDLYSCGSLNFSLTDVNHFEEMFEICRDKKTTATIEIRSAIRLIEREKKNDDSPAGHIMNKIADELLNK